MERRMAGADRRRQSINSVIYGSLHPRRRENRRIEDDQRYLVDIYDTGLIMVSLAIVLMSCLDAFFTLKLLSMGASELNYLMDVLIKKDVQSFLTVKLLATSTGVVFLTAMARYRLLGVLQVRRVLEFLCGIYACLIVWELFLLSSVAVAQLA